VRLDAAAIVRTATTLSSDGDDVGHTVRGEVRIGRDRAIGVGGQLFNEIEPVEDWQLSNVETALAAFVARHDYRDYYQRHGARGTVTLYGARDLSLSASYGQERWTSRLAQNPFSLFNSERDWRPNPLMNEGVLHIADLALKFDTRTDPMDPWSGWFLSADVEHGTPEYTRGFFDFRRYNRLGPSAQLNMRLIVAGWMGGGFLPRERKLSVDGPGALPGFGFRSTHTGIDVGNCNVNPAGATPALCDRIALAQVEYRGDIKLNLLRGWEDWPRRYRTSHGDLSWVVFADAGRGWVVESNVPNLSYGNGTLPPLSSFRTDVGVGIDVAGVGLYVAKALSASSEPANFFVRLRHRF
jgi:outer membrane protein assembly factor BamA